MKLIKSLACLMLVSAATLSAATFVNNVDEETNFDNTNAAAAAIQSFLENSVVEVSTLGMTSTVGYPLTATEAAVLSLTSLFSIITDDTTIDALRSVFGVFSQNGTAGVDALSAIEFTTENTSDEEHANAVKQSVAALFTSEGGALREATTTTPWGVSSDKIVVQAEGDADTATILSLNYFQKSIIELAREESAISLSDDHFLNTLTLLTYGAVEALSILESHIGAANLESHTGTVKLELLNALGQEVRKQEEANVSASMMSSSFVGDAAYQPIGTIINFEETEEDNSSVEEGTTRDRLISVDHTNDEVATTIEYGEDL